MGFQWVSCVVNGYVATVVIDRSPVNALNAEVVAELSAVATQLATQSEIRAVIITGGGTKAFVAGADIHELQTMRGRDGYQLCSRGQACLQQLADLPMPVIAAINGFALGGGCELALACDLRVIAENAKIGLPEVNLGVLPGYGGTQRLSRLIATGKAKEMLFTGEMLTAAEACQIGLADRLVPAGQALEVAQQIAAKIQAKGPLAVRAIKKIVNAGLECPLPQGFFLEAQLQQQLFDTEDKNEGVQAFLEKRKPVFVGK